jgi:hypothetical protein
MVPPPNHNTVTVCNQITLLILYYINSRLVTLLKIIHAPVYIFLIVLLVSSSSRETLCSLQTFSHVFVVHMHLTLFLLGSTYSRHNHPPIHGEGGVVELT